MDLFLGIATAVFVFLLLAIASIRDYQTKEVSNWVWLVGLFALPVALFRIWLTGLWFIYGFQILLVVSIVISGFRAGVLGGADGKAVLIISVLYPWKTLEPLWVLIAPFTILIGGFLLLGVHSLWLLIRNISTWRQLSKTRERIPRPERKTYWLTRSLSKQYTQSEQWNLVEVPLIVYFFVAFICLLSLTAIL